MFAIIRRSPFAFFIALLLHVGLVAFLVIGVDWREKPKPIPSDARVVQAQLVDSADIDKEVKRLKQAETDRKKQVLEARQKEEARLAELKQRREQEKKRLAKLESERKAREKSEAEAKRKAEAEQERLAEIERKQREIEKKQQAEKKRLAALEAKRKAAQEKARAEAERKRKQAEREKAEAEQRRKAEEARRKREAAARARAEAEARERELQAQFEAEQRASEASRIVRLIQDKVARQWNPPPGTLDKGLRCRINVRLGASGSVLAVSIVESSGNAGFDRSVEAAVWKAEPLPMPDEASLRSLDTFRNHTFTFDPSKSL